MLKLETVGRLLVLTGASALSGLYAYQGQRTPRADPASAAKEQKMFLGLRTATYDVKDLAKAKAWYGAVLGIQPYFDEPYYVGFNVGGYELGLVPNEAVGPQRLPAGLAYWGVRDAHAAYKRLLELGATPQAEVQDVGDGILVGAVHDPFGNVLGVIQNPHFKLPEN
jgi:predicted enzyme related to lactoylglutathione lyase